MKFCNHNSLYEEGKICTLILNNPNLELGYIIQYLEQHKYLERLIIKGEPLSNLCVGILYKLLKNVRDNLEIWLYTEYDWGEFRYWRSIVEACLMLDDRYITRLKILNKVDVIHCRNIHSQSDYSLINVKESLKKNDIILYDNNTELDESEDYYVFARKMINKIINYKERRDTI